MSNARKLLVAYDIADQKRLRKVADVVEGYGYRMQYSVFVCHLSQSDIEKMKNALLKVINHATDQCLFIDLGPSSSDDSSSIETIGRPLLTIPSLTIV